MSQKMWSLFSSNNILKLLNTALEDQTPVTVWQSSSQQSFQLHGYFTEVDEKKSSILVSEKEFEFNPSEVVYFHCEGVDMIFKRDKYTIHEGSISFKTPSELMLKEKRRIDRFRFKYQDFKDVRFSYENKELANDDEESSRNNVSFTLVDLSIAGLGCIGERKQIERLDVGSDIFIEQISDQELEHKPLRGTIRSLCDYDLKEGVHSGANLSKYVRIGVEFDKAIEEIHYESVQSIVTRTQKKTKGLDIDGFNGLNEVERLRVIKKAGEENPVLAKDIIEQSEDIDRLRYLTSEMKATFWTEVNKDLLAQALRVASKELIYTLLSEVTDNMRNEFLEELDRPKSLSAISKAQAKICEFVHQREREGRFVLSAKSYVKYV